MAQNRAGRRKCFTVEEANAMLPLVRAIVSDLAQLSREVLERRRRLSFLLGDKEPNDHDPYQQELVQVRDELEKDNRRLREYVEELRALGVEPLHGPDGMVAFPSMIEERRVCLSWKLGEPEVLHWHEMGAGYRRRKRLPSGSLASG